MRSDEHSKFSTSNFRLTIIEHIAIRSVQMGPACPRHRFPFCSPSGGPFKIGPFPRGGGGLGASLHALVTVRERNFEN